MKKRGQQAIEYLMIVGFAVIIIIVIYFIYSSYSGTTSDEITIKNTETIVSRMVQESEKVYYYQGKNTIKVNLPANIQSIEFDKDNLIFYITIKLSSGEDQKIPKISKVPITIPVGAIEAVPGKRTLTLTYDSGANCNTAGACVIISE